MPHSDNGAPLVKRQKLSSVAAPQASALATGSNIFAPFRTVGLVSPTGVPFASVPLGKTTFQITTSVGRCLQTYDLKRGLHLVFVTRPQTPRDITATYAWKHKVFAAWGGGEIDATDDTIEEAAEEEEAESDSSSSSSPSSPPNRNQGVWVYKRGRKIAELPLPRDLREPLRQILVFGAWIIGLATTRIEVWKSTTLEHYTTLQPTASSSSSSTPGGHHLTGGMCTMPTFLNKLFVGRADGWVEIWNVSSGKLVYTIVPPKTEQSPGGVTCLEPTPALGLLAIAYAAGPLVIHDVIRDQPLIYVEAGTPGVGFGDDNDNDNDNEQGDCVAPVTSISFRTDGRGAGQDGRAEGVMATATTASGDVTFWDLNKGGRIMGVLRSAHNPPFKPVASTKMDLTTARVSKAVEQSSSRRGRNNNNSKNIRGEVCGGISRVQFLPGQPVIMTSGLDNSLRSWIFDATPFSPVPRILHTRSGHAAPVNCLEFLPSDFDGADSGNKWLLSGGLDRSLWGWSLRRDGQSAELSQGNVRKRAKQMGILSSSALRNGSATLLEDLKAPPITCIASSLNRDGGMGALPGKPPQWLRMGPNGTTDTKHKTRAGDNPRPQDTESAGMTGWESVVTAHYGDAFARTWFWGRKRAGRWALSTGDNELVSTVAMSPCGTFALVGSAGGAVDMYNLQSGIHRQRFPSKLTPAQARQLKVQQQLRQADAVTQLQATATMGASATTAGGKSTRGFMSPGAGKHTAAVTGIVVDSLNSVVVTCSLDGTIKFWDFLTGHLVSQIGGRDDKAWAGVPITLCKYHAANDLLAFACADNTIRVVDMITKKVIRIFRAGSASAASTASAIASINDLCFSSDGRWIVAVTQHDARLRVWDLPTSHLIDSVRLDRPGRAVAFSGTGEYLAVAPDGALGVHLWTNKTLFKHVPTRPVVESDATSKTTKKAMAPTVSGEGGTNLLEAAFEEDKSEEGEGEDVAPAAQMDQLSTDMTTLSLVPKARWQTLLHLDLIKQRNRPREAPKAPEKAPFFLGTIASGDAEEAALAKANANQNQNKSKSSNAQAKGDLATTTTTTTTTDAGRSRMLALDLTRAQQALTQKLHRGPDDNYAAFVEHLKKLPAAQADMELRSLAPEDGELALFVRAMTSRLRARRDYELVQAWMAVFLKIHGSVAAAPSEDESSDDTLDEFAAALAEWRQVQDQERSRLDALVGYCSGVVAFLRNPRT